MNFNRCREVILDNFRSMKLEKEYAKFQLIQFQLLDLISHYEKLIELEKDIKLKYFEVRETLKYNELVDFDIDPVKWDDKKNHEIKSFENELNLLNEYARQITDILKSIDDGSVEDALKSAEKELLKYET